MTPVRPASRRWSVLVVAVGLPGFAATALAFAATALAFAATALAVATAGLASAAATPASGGDDGGVQVVGAFSQAPVGERPPPGWQPLTFPRIARHTRYTCVRDDEGVVVVRADSDASASGLTRRVEIDPVATPILSWRWRVSNVLSRGDVTRKAGDDYPARIYVTFAEDPARLGWLERARFRVLRLLYGEAPPVAALDYIWANHAAVGRVVPNAYTDRVRMIVVESGTAHVGEWRSERRDVAADYRRAFGGPVPRISGVALMSDSDDTGQSAVAWFGDIAFRPAGPGEAPGGAATGSPDASTSLESTLPPAP